MSVKERLKEYIKFKNISTSEFCRTIGVSAAFVSSMRKSIQPDKLKSIALYYPDLDQTWLLTGDGEMLKNAAYDKHTIEETPLKEGYVPYEPGIFNEKTSPYAKDYKPDKYLQLLEQYVELMKENNFLKEEILKLKDELSRKSAS